ncbi:sensor histidine kinase [Roseomonas haemaphysalidis]|uniref:histidine kinase n=1 Tax=Roseomonas haemaphysalidis TaxID=2768162 RepID=A0ABS3KVA5_9PROT|nr:PAS domain-containing protein [Roseomonas haemaphysalidis]MBO1081420.1 PAS domain-containing protein [Roseomonas haemaphysalidis]
MVDVALLSEQTRMLGDFGQFALRAQNLDEVLQRACELLAGMLRLGRARMLELRPGERQLLVRASLGWDAAPPPPALRDGSAEEAAIRSAAAVAIGDTRLDRRFAAMPAPAAGAVAVVHLPVLLPGGRCFGLLQADAAEPRAFSDGDLDLLPVLSAMLGPAVDRLLAASAPRGDEARFRMLVDGMPQLVWCSVSDGRWTWASRQWTDYTGQEQQDCQGLGWLDVVHPDDRGAMVHAWQSSPTHGGLDVECRLRRAADGSYRWHRVRSLPLRAGPDAGQPRGGVAEWLGTCTDVDDLKRAQDRQGILVAELQHRTRNLLGVVQSIASRSMAPSPGRETYNARLSALGRVQGFLSCSPEWSVSLFELLAAELVAVGDGLSERVEVRGPPLQLPGNKVQPMALALHELATNAMKYGAIGQPDGRLQVEWTVEAEPGGRQLVLDWRESGVAMPDDQPARRGFGSELITRALPYQLKAKTRLEFGDDGVHCRIVLPLGSAPAQKQQQQQRTA